MELQVNNVTLHYEMMGQGKPLIMVHGNGESLDIFLEAAQVLKKYFTVYLIDSRGHGKSSPVDEFHYQDMANDIKEFIEKLELKDVTYYGFSDGGIIGILLASQTRYCRQYIVSGSNVDPNAVKPGLKIMMHVISKFKKDPLIELMIKEPHISKEEMANIQDDFVILAGSKDVIKESHTKYIHECIPNSRLEIIQGKTHGNYIVHQKDIAYYILKYSFLQGENK